MVVSVSFNKRLPPGAVGRGTLAELMAKEKAAALAKTQVMSQMESPTIMQGIGNMAHIGLNAFREGKAARDLSIQQERQRELVQQINPLTGATNEQAAAMGEFDPELMMELWKDRASRMRDDERFKEEQKIKEFEYQRGKADEAEINAREGSEEEFRYKRGVTDEANIDIREAGQEADINTRELQEQADADAAAKAAEDAEHARDLKEGKLRIVTGDEAAALGGDPKRQYRVSVDGDTLEDVTPKVDTTYTFRPGTEEERAAYGIPPGQPFKMKVGSDGSEEPSAIGSGINVSSQDSSRLAMIDNFGVEVPYILRDIDNGVMTGLGGRLLSEVNQGRVGEINRQVSEAADLISRFLTGAGKNLVEVEEFSARYMPNTRIDNAVTMRSKIEQLNNALQGMKSGVLTQDFDAWRNQRVAERAAQEQTGGGGATPAPNAGGGATSPYTLEQIQQERRRRDALKAAGGG